MVELIRVRLVRALLEASLGVMIWRRPDPTAQVSLWRRAAVFALARVAAALMDGRWH
jgi:hypothetical protein